MNNLIFKALLVSVFSLSISASACEYVDKYHWEFTQEENRKNIQEITIFKDEKLCGPELDVWREKINHIFSNAEIKDQLFSKNNELIHSSTYRTGAWGLRITPKNNHSAKKHLLVAGDSSVFGIGVNDSETIAQRLVGIFPDHKLYNFGFPNRGPASLLYMLENYLLKTIHSNMLDEGKLIYIFNNSQIKTMLGSRNLIDWGASLPNYEINKKGEISFAGTFDDLFVTKIYRFLNYFNFLGSIVPNFPLIEKEHIFKIAKIFLKIKDLYLKQTSAKNDFIVLLINSNQNSKDYNNLKLISGELNRQSVKSYLIFDKAVPGKNLNYGKSVDTNQVDVITKNIDKILNPTET